LYTNYYLIICLLKHSDLIIPVTQDKRVCNREKEALPYELRDLRNYKRRLKFTIQILETKAEVSGTIKARTLDAASDLEAKKQRK